MDPGKRKREYTCATCPEKKQQQLKCREPGFDHFTTERERQRFGKPDQNSAVQSFCPAKATWPEFADIAEVFEHCRVAVQTGLLPQLGAIEDQDEMFTEVFPVFVHRWKIREYAMVWEDVAKFTPEVLKAIAKMFSGKK